MKKRFVLKSASQKRRNVPCVPLLKTPTTQQHTHLALQLLRCSEGKSLKGWNLQMTDTKRKWRHHQFSYTRAKLIHPHESAQRILRPLIHALATKSWNRKSTFSSDAAEYHRSGSTLLSTTWMDRRSPREDEQWTAGTQHPHPRWHWTRPQIPPNSSPQTSALDSPVCWAGSTDQCTAKEIYFSVDLFISV